MKRDALLEFRPAVQEWFRGALPAPTAAQAKGWPPILAGRSTLLLAPTGSGKTLAAFLAAIDRLMFSPEPAKNERCRVLYVSPLKALAVDVERNLRAPLAGIAADRGSGEASPFRLPAVAIRSGDTPAAERARIVADAAGHPHHDAGVALPAADVARRARPLRSVETVIVDEIHCDRRHQARRAPLPLARAARSAPASERPRPAADRPSATQRPLEEIARLLGGGEAVAGHAGAGAWKPRPVEIVDAGSRKALRL